MCGPTEDREFFAEIDRVFARFPEAAQRYAISCQCLARESMKVDFGTTVAIKSLDGDRIVTRFVDRAELANDETFHAPCCEWSPTDNPSDHHRSCVAYCDI